LEYVYPTIRDGKLINLENADVGDDLAYLLKHLIHNRAMVSADIKDVANLQISAREIIKQIPEGSGDWENCVPSSVATQIKQQKLFGFPG